MTRRLLASYLTITVFVLIVLEVPLGVSFARGELDRLTASVERDARVIATVVEDTLEGTDDIDPQLVADEYAARTGGRVVVVDPAGTSLADSDRPGERRDFSSRPEFDTALQGETASGSRYSETLGERFLYVAVPVASGGRILGAVRVTYPRAELDDRIRGNWLRLGALAGVVVLAVVLVGTLLARSVTRPVRALAAASNALAGGDLGARAPAGSGPPEVRALARSFNVMADRLERLVTGQRAFVADASHELRAPLTALRLRLENLERDASGRTAGEVRAAAVEVDRLTRLVDALLHLARAEATAPARRQQDLAAAVRERVATWEPLAEEQGIRVRAQVPATAPVLVADGAVAQVLDNLLANAFEHAPAGSVVEVRVVPAGGVHEVHVIDQGPGMPPEHRRRAFDRFWRAPDAPPGGSGLGLAIVARLVAASGGTVELRDAPGGGLDAVVTFSAAPA
ncbi:MAG: two-component sensor histidine kinase [Acidimicrobiia bacterium]|nr:MAG: two-component sensor histidine kinase [Acidimicrobiia bacterium]